MVDRHPIPVVHKDELFSVTISYFKIIYDTIRKIYFFEIKKECNLFEAFLRWPCGEATLRNFVLASSIEGPPIGLRPSCWTPWLFAPGHTHKYRFVEHCEPPLQERADQTAPFGLDFLDFHGKL